MMVNLYQAIFSPKECKAIHNCLQSGDDKIRLVYNNKTREVEEKVHEPGFWEKFLEWISFSKKARSPMDKAAQALAQRGILFVTDPLHYDNAGDPSHQLYKKVVEDLDTQLKDLFSKKDYDAIAFAINTDQDLRRLKEGAVSLYINYEIQPISADDVRELMDSLEKKDFDTTLQCLNKWSGTKKITLPLLWSKIMGTDPNIKKWWHEQIDGHKNKPDLKDITYLMPEDKRT